MRQERPSGRSISFILGKISAFLGGLADVMEAASHLPIVGDKFKGIAEKIRNAPEQTSMT